MKQQTMQAKMFRFNVLFIIFITVATGISFYFTLSQAIEREIGLKALSIAQTTAKRADIIAGFHAQNPSEVLQPIAEEIRQLTNSEYVVIGDVNGIRYAHPIVERIGQSMVGDDNERALLQGEAYISEATGSLGPAIRGKAPVFDEAGNIIGVISVGFLKTKMSAVFWQYADNILFIILLGILFGVIATSMLSRKIKKELLDYEPIEIATLLKQRNALIESVREGIIMIDDKGCITMVNHAAHETLSLPETVPLVGRKIDDILPNTHLLEVLSTGEKQLDRSMEIRGKMAVVNRVPIWSGEQVVGAVASFRLQSEIDQLAMELSQVKKYTEALRAQTHEYNNFLYTISGLVQLQSYEEVLDLIHSERAEQDNLIQFLSKRLKDPFLSGILIGFFNRAKELKVKLILDEDSSLAVLPNYLQKHLFVSIFGNLMTNAFEAVEHLAEDERIVRVLIYDNGQEIIIEVEDSGEGLSEEVNEALFTKRVTTKSYLTERRGYGLLKVYENVQELGGVIYTEKGDLGGALFIIVIQKQEGE